MAYSFNSDPPIPAGLVGTPVEAEMQRRRELARVRAAVAEQPKAKPRKETDQEDVLAMAAQAKQGAKEYDRGVAAAVAMADGAAAEEEMAQQTAPVVVAGNVTKERPVPVMPVQAQPAQTSLELHPKRATSFYEAVQQMDPLGQAVIAGALGVPAETFRTNEEREIEKRNAGAVLRWRTAMDDPNSAERKALDGGDLDGFTRMAIAAGAIDAPQGVNLLDGLRSEDNKRNAYGFDAKVYDQALVPVVAKSSILTAPSLAAMKDDVPMIGEDGRVIEFDVPKLLTLPGSVEDVNRSVATAATEDILGTRDMRPYVMAGNNAFYDQIGTYLSYGINYDPVTGVGSIPDLNSGFLGLGGDEPNEALMGNLKSYIQHQRVALVASRRYAPEAVQAMDDMQILSIATGKPRMAAIVDADGEPLLGDIKTVLQQQTLYAPNGYNSILQATMPKTTATGDGKKPEAKKAKP